MRLSLPDVTLVAVDAVAHNLTRQALEDTLSVVTPSETRIWSDRRIVELDNASYEYAVPSTLQEAAEVLWWKVPHTVRTSHYLKIEWDGWVISPQSWTPEFLAYDYIGAPWPHRRGAVGNGGFSLRSARLGKFLAERNSAYPVRHPEDETLCCEYRQSLEREGFKWAPSELAGRFSVEHGDLPDVVPFGFHDCSNWPHLLGSARTYERYVMANEYVRQKMRHRLWIEPQGSSLN
jgi:hypothetical protein